MQKLEVSKQNVVYKFIIPHIVLYFYRILISYYKIQVINSF